MLRTCRALTLQLGGRLAAENMGDPAGRCCRNYHICRHDGPEARPVDPEYSRGLWKKVMMESADRRKLHNLP